MNRIILRTCKTYQGKVFEFCRPKRLFNANQEVGFGWIQFADGDGADKFVYFNEEEIIDGQKSALFTTSQPKVEFTLGERPVKSHLDPIGTGSEVTTAVEIKITAPGQTPRVDRLAAQFKHGSSTPDFPHFAEMNSKSNFDESRVEESIWGLNTAAEEKANWAMLEASKKAKIEAIEAAAEKIKVQYDENINFVNAQRESQRRAVFKDEFATAEAEQEKALWKARVKKSLKPKDFEFTDKEKKKYSGIDKAHYREWVMERHWTKRIKKYDETV